MQPRDVVTWTQHWNGAGAILREHSSVVQRSNKNGMQAKLLVSYIAVIDVHTVLITDNRVAGTRMWWFVNHFYRECILLCWMRAPCDYKRSTDTKIRSCW